MFLMTRWDIPPVCIGKSVLSGFGVLLGPWPHSCFASLLFLDRETQIWPGDLRVVAFVGFFVIVIVCDDLPFF